MVMATTFSASSPSRHHHRFTYSYSKSFGSEPLIFSHKFHPHRPYLPVRLRSNFNARPPRCPSAGPGPPSPPDGEPPRPPEYAGKVFGFQDRAQTFFAVLFWMSLFFWSSAWDGRNSGRPNKGSRFRR